MFKIFRQKCWVSSNYMCSLRAASKAKIQTQLLIDTVPRYSATAITVSMTREIHLCSLITLWATVPSRLPAGAASLTSKGHKVLLMRLKYRSINQYNWLNYSIAAPVGSQKMTIAFNFIGEHNVLRYDMLVVWNAHRNLTGNDFFRNILIDAT